MKGGGTRERGGGVRDRTSARGAKSRGSGWRGRRQGREAQGREDARGVRGRCGGNAPGTLPFFSFISATLTRTSSRTCSAMALPSMMAASARADLGSARAAVARTAPARRLRDAVAEIFHPRVVAEAAEDIAIRRTSMRARAAMVCAPSGGRSPEKVRCQEAALDRERVVDDLSCGYGPCSNATCCSWLSRPATAPPRATRRPYRPPPGLVRGRGRSAPRCGRNATPTASRPSPRCRLACSSISAPSLATATSLRTRPCCTSTRARTGSWRSAPDA